MNSILNLNSILNFNSVKFCIWGVRFQLMFELNRIWSLYLSLLLRYLFTHLIFYPDLEEPLSVHSPYAAVVQAMHRADSGLEIRDRMWLKITIPNAFIGTDMIEWLLRHVEGFQDRRDARKYASQLLKAGFIRHTVNKISFSEQCYYIFGDLCSAMSNLKIGHGDNDSVGPLPNVPNYMPYSGTYNPMEYMPMPFYTSENTVYGYNREESVLSGSGKIKFNI